MLGVASTGPLGPVTATASHATADGGGSADGGASADGVTERQALAVLVTVDDLGPATLGRLVAAVGSARRVLDLGAAGDEAALLRAAATDDRRARSGLGAAIVTAARAAPSILDRLERARVEVVSHGEAPTIRSAERLLPFQFCRQSERQTGRLS